VLGLSGQVRVYYWTEETFAKTQEMSVELVEQEGRGEEDLLYVLGHHDL